MATSQNGWAVLRSSVDPRMRAFPWVTGKVRRGDVYTVLDYLARRFNDEVEPIVRAKSWGWAYRAIRGQSSGYSNHASATAADFNAPDHWLGLRGTFTGRQVAAIRRILSDLDGVVRWGGDYQNRADEMHFEINANAAAVRRVAQKIRNEEDDMPSAEEIARAVWAQRDKVSGKRRSKLLRMAARSKKVARKNRDVIRRRAGVNDEQLDAVLAALDELDDQDAAGE